jgi:SAM-dependent methyltransferase
MTTPPDPERARERYDVMASRYDRGLAPFERIRRRLRASAIRSLALEPGETVLDVGCGTGLSLPELVAATGPGGRVVAVDQSEGMLELARRRVAESGWHNVQLICSPVERAALPPADGALLFFTHDLMRSPAALDNVIAAIRDGRHVAAAGAKTPRGPLGPLGRLAMRRYVTTLDGATAPWTVLAERLDELTVRDAAFGMLYRATGRVPRAPSET